MKIIVTMGLAYAGATFLLSAILVRLLPESASARKLRQSLALFPVFPAFFIYETAAAIVELAKVLARWATRTFEMIAGQPQMRRAHASYDYGRMRRRSRRKQG